MGVSSILSKVLHGVMHLVLTIGMLCSGNFPGNEVNPEDLTPMRARFLGCVWSRSQARSSIVSQDGGFSYAVPGGTLWWFGDTFSGVRDKDGKPHFQDGAVSCSVAFQPDGEKNGIPVLTYLEKASGKVQQAIPFISGESWEKHRIWPLSGIYLGGRSFVYYSLIRLTGQEGWGFEGAGAGLACSKSPFAIHERVIVNGEWQFPVEPSCVLHCGEWLYLFEVMKWEGNKAMTVARVPVAELEDPGSYEFYSGPGPRFSREKSGQVPLLQNIHGQVSVVWNDHLKKYLLAASSDFFRPRDIMFYVADEPSGPWGAMAGRITVPEVLQGKKVKLVYCTYFHPNLFRENGRIMHLTFSVHLVDAGFDANNEAVEVEILPLPKKEKRDAR